MLRGGGGKGRGGTKTTSDAVADQDVDYTRTEASKEAGWSSKCVPVTKKHKFSDPTGGPEVVPRVIEVCNCH